MIQITSASADGRMFSVSGNFPLSSYDSIDLQMFLKENYWIPDHVVRDQSGDPVEQDLLAELSMAGWTLWGFCRGVLREIDSLSFDLSQALPGECEWSGSVSYRRFTLKFAFCENVWNYLFWCKKWNVSIKGWPASPILVSGTGSA